MRAVYEKFCKAMKVRKNITRITIMPWKIFTLLFVLHCQVNVTWGLWCTLNTGIGNSIGLLKWSLLICLIWLNKYKGLNSPTTSIWSRSTICAYNNNICWCFTVTDVGSNSGVLGRSGSGGLGAAGAAGFGSSFFLGAIGRDKGEDWHTAEWSWTLRSEMGD